jgi:hypothetical protein
MSGLALPMRPESLALGTGPKNKLHQHWHPAFPLADFDRRLGGFSSIQKSFAFLALEVFFRHPKTTSAQNPAAPIANRAACKPSPTLLRTSASA